MSDDRHADARTTVVIATRDRREKVLEVIPRLQALPERPPVIVVDDDSSDGTAAAVAERHRDVTVLRAPVNLGGAARTLGVRAARTPYVAFCDDDSWYAPGSLRHGADLLDRYPQVGLLAASVCVEPHGRADPTNHAMAHSPLRPAGLPGPEVLGFVACGAIVRRDAYLRVGGFDRRLRVGGEEELLALDLRASGWRCVYAEGVRVHHQPETAPRPARRRTVARNTVWVAVMRRSPGSVARIVASVARDAARDPAARQGLFDAVVGLPEMWSSRRRLPRQVERDKRRVERMAG